MFRATESELRAALPTLKVPLAEPVVRRSRNPFTGEIVDSPSWDPNPDAPIQAVDGRDVPALAYFSPDTMVRRDEDNEGFMDLLGIVLGSSDELERLAGGRPALIGPVGEPAPFEVPPFVVAKLAAMREEGLADLADRWMLASIPDFRAYRRMWEGGQVWSETVKQHHETVVALSNFAQTALSRKQRVYVYLMP